MRLAQANGGTLQQAAQFFLGLVQRTDPWGIGLFLFFGSWLLMSLLGGPMIRWLRDKRWRKDIQTQEEAWQVREDTPETHQKKQGTPSMGGIGIIGVAFSTFTAVQCTIVFCALLTLPLPPKSLMPRIALFFLVPLTTVAHAGLGFADDWSKASGRGGLRARAKLAGQVALEVLFLGVLVFFLLLEQTSGPPLTEIQKFSHLLANPTFNSWLVLAGLLLMLVLTCNAVNLTDGIDGLASGLSVQAGLAFFLTWSFDNSGRGGGAAWFWAALAGSCLGFLSFNKYPAKVFMGDTGSLALGAALGAAAIMCHAVFLLPFIGFIYFVEAGSVTLQVLYFKYTRRKFGEGRRIFRRAPLHHHFELGGWSEWRVVGTFWGINLITSAIGLILWHLKVLPRFP